MKTLTDYISFQEEVTSKTSHTTDYLVAANDIALVPEAPTSKHFDCPILAGGQVFAGSQLLHQQLAEIADIPARYYERLHVENRQLLAQCVDNGMRGKKRTLMLRTRADNPLSIDREPNTAFALLSDCYKRLDNIDLMYALDAVQSPAWHKRQIRSCGDTGERIHLKVSLPTIQNEIRQIGDVVELGISVSNSECGRGALTVQLFLYELSCTNGAVICRSGAESTRRTHFGTRLGREDYRLCELPRSSSFLNHNIVGQGFAELGAKNELSGDAQFWYDAVTARVNVLARQSMLDGIVDAARKAQDAKINNNDSHAVWEAIARMYKLSGNEQRAARELYDAADNRTVWGISRAITEMSQGADSYERAHELEILGGSIIDMPRRDFQLITTA